MSIPANYKCDIDIESSYGAGGSSFTSIPLTFDSVPKARTTPVTLPVVGGSKARQPSYPDEPWYEIPVKFFLKGSGVAGTVPELGKLFRGFGFQETDGASTVTYDPRDSSYESVELRINTDGVRYQCLGAKGVQLKIPLVAGKRVQCEGTLWSLYTAPTAVAYSAPTFADTAVRPAVVQSMALTIGGNTHVIPEITFNFDNTAEWEPNINAANFGKNDVAYDTRNWTFETFLKRDASSDIEYWTNHDASTEIALASTGFGSAGNLIDFDASNCQIIEPPEEVVRVGQIYYKIVAGFNYNATLANQFRMKFA